MTMEINGFPYKHSGLSARQLPAFYRLFLFSSKDSDIILRSCLSGKIMICSGYVLALASEPSECL